jgi:alkylhydroperoxidase/carboxymuconolactone decarboxylase family protein YurZ
MAKEIKRQPQIIRSRLQAALRKKLNPEDRDLLNLSLKAAKKAEEMALAEKKEPLLPLAVSLIGPAARAKGWSRDEVLDLLEEAGIDDESTAFRIYQAIEASDGAGNGHH